MTTNSSANSKASEINAIINGNTTGILKLMKQLPMDSALLSLKSFPKQDAAPRGLHLSLKNGERKQRKKNINSSHIYFG